MDKIIHTVSEEEMNNRIDKVITAINREWSRTQIQQWIKDGYIFVNDKKVKSNYKCQSNDVITILIPEPEPMDVKSEQMDLDIYFEDQDVLVVNKPRGMVVHPAPGHLSGTLVNGLLAHCDDLSGINGILRPGIVHRIDKDTSGLLMVAKNDMAHKSLVKQLVEKTVVRKYKALVHGVMPHDKGTIDAPIGRDKEDRQKMTVTNENSRDAVTHFQILKRFKNFTFVECKLETGRTHQIRVHMKYIGFPLAGDPKYGPRKTLSLNGQALHAGLLGFKHPRTGIYQEFEAPMPKELQSVLDEFSKSN